MFYISSKKGDKYGVTDTKDKAEEFYTLEEIKHYCNSGIDIRGYNNGMVKCISDNVLNDFTRAVKSIVAKLKLLNVTERNERIKRVRELALQFGVIENANELSVDIEGYKLFLNSPAYNTFIDYYTGDMIQKIDVCDKRVADLSRLGEKAFDNITLKVGKDLIITMHDVLNEIQKVENTGYKTIHNNVVHYIGITPTNRMFKVFVGDNLFSVKVDLYDKVKQDYKKIKSTKVKKHVNFLRYLDKVLSSPHKQDFVISKFTTKNIVLIGRLDVIIGNLKDKYPTLHDVYIRYASK